MEVRLSGLLQQVEHGLQETGPDGLSPAEQLQRIATELHSFVTDQYHCWNSLLLPKLMEEGIRVLSMSSLDHAAKDAMDLYYIRQVDPLLTPVTIDPSHPFPHVINKALCVAFSLRQRRRPANAYLGVVTVPRKLPRVVRVPSRSERIDYVFLHDLIEAHTRNLYKGFEVVSSGAFRGTRNSNLYLHEEESRSILESVDSLLHNRRKGDVVRLEIEADAAPEIVEPLTEQFALRAWQVFKTPRPVNLSRLFSLAEQTARPDLKFSPFVPKSITFAPKMSNIYRASSPGRCPVAPSVRLLPTGGLIYRGWSARSSGAFDKTDSLSDKRGFTHRPYTHGGRPDEGSSGRGRTQSSLR